MRFRSEQAGALAGVLTLALLSSGCAGHANETLWHPFTDWSYATRLGTVIRDSSWLFAVIESVHLVGLALIGGSILIADMRLVNLGLRDESVVEVTRAVRPVFLGALIVMLISGCLLYLSEATRFYSEGFWDSAEFPFIYKMLFLAMAIAFTFTIQRRVLASQMEASPARRRLVALISLLLWLGVAVGGRAIGFY